MIRGYIIWRNRNAHDRGLRELVKHSDPVSETLGSDRVVSLQQQMDNRWCIETEVSALLSSETVFFVINDDGQFVETPDGRG